MIEFINQYGIYAIMAMIALEYACFPIPSEIVLPLSGLILKSEGFNFLFIVFLSTISGIVGIIICYCIGRFLGFPILNKIKRMFPSSSNALEETERKYLKSSKKAVLIGRMIPICRTYVSFFSGLYKQRLLSFILFSSIGIFVWNMMLMGIGYYFSHKIDINIFYENYKLITLSIIGLYIIIYIIKKEIKYKKRLN